MFRSRGAGAERANYRSDASNNFMSTGSGSATL